MAVVGILYIGCLVNNTGAAKRMMLIVGMMWVELLTNRVWYRDATVLIKTIPNCVNVVVPLCCSGMANTMNVFCINLHAPILQHKSPCFEEEGIPQAVPKSQTLLHTCNNICNNATQQ